MEEEESFGVAVTFCSLLQLVSEREVRDYQSSLSTQVGIGGTPLAVGGYFQKALTEEGRCALHVGGTMQISGVPD